MLKKYCTIFYLFTILFSLLQANEKTHFTIAIDPEYIPFTQKDIDGKPTGLLVDFWDLWAQKNAYTVEYKFYPWEETLLATQRGEVDFHSGTTKDREWMHASDTIYQLRTALFTLSDSKLLSVIDLRGKRLGTIDSYYAELVKDVIGKDVIVTVYDDYAPMVEALKGGDIDFLVDDVEAVMYYFIKTGQMNRFKLLEDASLKFVNDIYAVSNAKNTSVLKQVNNGLKKLSLSELVKIEKAWLPNMDDAYFYKQFKAQVTYTSDETDWLKVNNSITLTGDPLWIPYTLRNDVYSYRGIVGDYIRVISQKTKINLEVNPKNNWTEILTPKDGNRSQVIFGAMNIDIQRKLSQYYDFLPTYESGPLVIITNEKIRYVTSLYDIKTKRIGILAEQEYTERLENTYIGYDFQKVSTVKQVLDQVKSGALDAGILSLSKAVLLLADYEYNALHIVGKMEEKVYVHIGVLKSEPMLKNILSKTLLSTLDEYKKEIMSKWTRKLNYIEKIDYTLTYTVAGLLSLLLFSTWYYVYALRKKHKYTEELTEILERLALTDDLTGLANKRAFNKKFENTKIDSEKIALLFIDVDYFKKYNDYYGHLEGDIALKHIADKIDTFSAENIFPYRIGGEEFGLILYGYDNKKAVACAKEVCKSIFTEEIEHKMSPLGVITVSIGVSVGRAGVKRHALYQCADKALYAAKELGRNKVFLNNCDK